MRLRNEQSVAANQVESLTAGTRRRPHTGNHNENSCSPLQGHLSTSKSWPWMILACKATPWRFPTFPLFSYWKCKLNFDCGLPWKIVLFKYLSLPFQALKFPIKFAFRSLKNRLLCISGPNVSKAWNFQVRTWPRSCFDEEKLYSISASIFSPGCTEFQACFSSYSFSFVYVLSMGKLCCISIHNLIQLEPRISIQDSC